MTKPTNTSWLSVMAIVLVLGAVACKDTGEAEPGDGASGGGAGSSGHAGKGGGNAGEGGHVIPDGGIATDGGFILNDAFVPFDPDGGGGNAGTGGNDGPCADGQSGTFDGKPSTGKEFLNQCTDSQCEPFDNVARLPLYEKGKPLPALP